MPSISFEIPAKGPFVICLGKRVAVILRYIVFGQITPILLHTMENECKHLSVAVFDKNILNLSCLNFYTPK